jgi:hypothetical protein
MKSLVRDRHNEDALEALDPELAFRRRVARGSA